MSLKKKTIRNLQFVGIAQLLSLGLVQLGYLFLARTLLPEDFGLYAAVIVVFNLAITVSMLGLDQAAIQSKDDSEELLRTASTFRMAMALLAIAVILIVAPAIASFYDKPEMTNPLRMMMIAVFISSAGFVSTVRLSKALRFRELSISRVGNALSWPVVAIAAAVIGLSYWSMIVATLFSSTVALAILWAYAPWKIGFNIDRAVLRKLLHFGKFPVATTLVVFLFFNMDKVVVGRLLGAEILGSYFLAFSIGTVAPTILTNVVNNVMFPTYARIAEDRQLLKESYRKTLISIAYVSIPIGIGLAAISSTLVKSILGPQWAEAEAPLAIFSFVGIASSLTSPAGSLFLAMGKPEIAWRITAILSLPYIVLLVPAALFLGIVGVSMLMLVQTTMSLIWVLIVASRLTDIRSGAVIRDLLRPTAAAATMGICIFALSIVLAPTIPSLMGLIVIGILLYAVAAHFASKGTIIREMIEMIRP